MQVATEHAKTVSQRAGIGVMEGLLFDRVALHSRGVTPGHLKLAPFVEADFADAQLPFGNAAAMATGETTHKTPVELFVKLAFANIGVKNVLKCGHESPKTKKHENRNWKYRNLENEFAECAGREFPASRFSPTIIPPGDYACLEHTLNIRPLLARPVALPIEVSTI